MKNKNKINNIFLFGEKRFAAITADPSNGENGKEITSSRPRARRPAKTSPELTGVSNDIRKRTGDVMRIISAEEEFPQIEIGAEIAFETKDLSSLEKALLKPETLEIAQTMFKDLLSIIRTPSATRPEKLQSVKKSYPEIRLPDFINLVLEFEKKFNDAYERIGREAYNAHINRAIHRYAEELAGFDREVVKTVLDEVRETGLLLGKQLPDGKAKTSGEYERDKAFLKERFLEASLGLSLIGVSTLFSTEDGKKLLEEIATSGEPAGIEVLKNINILQGPERALINHKHNLTPAQIEKITRRETDPEVINVLANDALNYLSQERIEALLEGRVDPDTVKILAVNIGHPEFNDVYLERIWKGPEIVTIDGIKKRYYPGSAALGKGGLGTFYRAAILDPSNKKLKFMGVKTANRESGINNLGSEVTGSRHVVDAANRDFMGGNLRAYKHFVKIHAIADDGAAIFYELIEKGGKNITLAQMMKDPDADPAELISYYLDSLRALTILHRQNILHGDYNASQVMVAESGGKLGDYGTVISGDRYLQNEKGVPARGVLYEGLGTMVIDTEEGSKLVWIGKIPCHSNEIAISPQYYSGKVFEAVAAAGPKAAWKIDAYAAGVQLKQLITGRIMMDAAKPKSDARGFEADENPASKIALVTGPPHTFPGPEMNTKLIQIASKLTDAGDLIYTVNDAIRDIENTIKENNILN